MNRLKIRLDYIALFSFFFGAFFVNIYGASTEATSIFTLISLFFLFYSLISSRKRIKSNAIINIYSLLVLLGTISFLYAYDQSYVFTVLSPMIGTLISMFAIYNYCTDLSKLKRFISAFLIVSTIYSLINLVNMQLGIRRLEIGGVNVAAVAIIVSIFFVLIMFYLNKKKYLLLMPIFIYFLILTASQKAIGAFIIFLAVFLFYQRKKIRVSKKTIKKSFITFLLIGVVTSYLSKQEELRYAFDRTSATFRSALTGEIVDGGAISSSGLREKLRSKGLEYFLDSPIIGYGLNNFRPLYGRETSRFTYSHSTPIELLVGMGFLGLIIYYSIFIVYFKRMKILREERPDVISSVFSSVIIPFVFIGLYQQTYFDFFIHCFLVVGLSYYLIIQKKN